jgi:hypothetical protein
MTVKTLVKRDEGKSFLGDSLARLQQGAPQSFFSRQKAKVAVDRLKTNGLGEQERWQCIETIARHGTLEQISEAVVKGDFTVTIGNGAAYRTATITMPEDVQMKFVEMLFKRIENIIDSYDKEKRRAQKKLTFFSSRFWRFLTDQKLRDHSTEFCSEMIGWAEKAKNEQLAKAGGLILAVLQSGKITSTDARIALELKLGNMEKV